jgi:tetratricopeptide (TPR) repeat protein
VRRRLLLAIALLAAAPLHAQGVLARADNLLRVGRMFAAETLYYYAVRRAPRDPEARLALGRYLAARGALRIGAVLMEEARYFGADPKKVAVYLAPVYTQLGDFRALAGLPNTPLHNAERSRAEWLRENPPTVEGPDSISIHWTPSDTGALGTVVVRVGQETVHATLDPRAHGLVLDTAWMRRKETKVFASKFDNDVRNAAGVTLAIALGEFRVRQVLTSFAPQASPAQAVIGLDVLMPFAPTIDAAARRILLRKNGRLDREMPGERVQTLVFGSGLWVIWEQAMLPLAGEEARRLLAGGAWTLDWRRGQLVAH